MGGGLPWLGLLALAAGCYAPDLGAAPFRCSEGVCPSGYRCAQELCVAVGQPDPPTLVGVSSDPAVAPEPVWLGDRFAVLWQEQGGAGQTAGLHLADAGGDRLLVARAEPTGAAAFDALYLAGRLVVAARENGDAGAHLELLRFDAASPQSPTVLWREDQESSAFGYSAPSLAAATTGAPGVLCAWTFGDPPQVARDNVFCRRVDLDGGATSTACRPSLLQTRGGFGTEVVVAAAGPATLLFWRDHSVHATPELGGIELARVEVAALHLTRAVVAQSVLGVVAEEPGPAGAPIWAVFLGTFAHSEKRPTATLPTLGLVPDLLSEGTRFVVCGRDASGELSLQVLSAFDLSALGPPLRVPRLSHAEITSCRIAADASGAHIAVAWQERVLASIARSYVEVVAQPAP